MIAVQKELPLGWPLESCCFCNRGTEYWSIVQDVAVCLACSKHRNESQVPTKAQWVRRGKEGGDSIQGKSIRVFENVSRRVFRQGPTGNPKGIA